MTYADGKFIKVSSQSKPKAVAGKIAHMSREGDPPATMYVRTGAGSYATQRKGTQMQQMESVQHCTAWAPGQTRQRATLDLDSAPIRPVYPLHAGASGQLASTRL